MSSYVTNGLRPYGPGKFTTVLDSLVYEATLDGADEELGDVHDSGMWYGRLNAPLYDEAMWANLTEQERDFLRLNGAGAIVSEDSNGFAHVEYFGDTAALEREWARLEVAHEAQS